MRVHLDNCCYNRPFDDQHNLATALESFAKLQIQSMMRYGELEYVWSDSLCHEDDLTIEELGRATRESGERIRSVLQADAAVSRLQRKD